MTLLHQDLDDLDVRRQLDDATRRAEILQRVVEAISSERDLEPLLARIIVSGVELLAAAHGSIGLMVERDGEPVIRIAAVHNMPPAELGAEYARGVGLAGRILETPSPTPVRFHRYDALHDAPISEYADHAVIGTPIFWAERLIGFLGIGDEAPRLFTEKDADTLWLFARHVAIAIENARLYGAERHRSARNATITEIGRLIASSLDVNEVLQNAADAIHEHLRYPDVALFVPDELDADVLWLRARGGVSPERVSLAYSQRLDDGIVGAAAQSRRMVRVDDTRHDPRYVPIPSVPGVQAELAIPIVRNQRLLGVLNIESQWPVGADDAEDLRLIADQLAVAMDHARTFEDEQRRAARLSLITRTGQRIAARLNPDDLFNTIVNDLRTRLGFDHAALFMLDMDDASTLVQVACSTRWPDSAHVGYRQNINRGIVGAAARLRVSQNVHNVNADARFVPMTDDPILRAELAVPITLGDRLLGVLDVAGAQPFRPEDDTSLQILAGQLAVAIDNAELFSNTQRALDEMRLLYDASRQISVAMRVDDVIEAYLEQVAMRGPYACTIGLYEHDLHGRRTQVAVRGRWSQHEGLMRMNRRIPYVRDSLDELLEDGQTVAIADISTDDRANEELRAMQLREGRPALAFIPLLVRGIRIGLVILSATEVHPWTDEDLRPYQTTAAQLATAIDSRMQQSLVVDRGQRLAVLEERQRLARELHDSVTQLIFSTTLIAQSIAPAWRRSPGEGEKRVARMLELSQAALAEMRALLFELRPTEPLPPGHAKAETPSTSSDRRQATVDHPGGAMPGLMRVEQEGLAAAIERYARDVSRDGLSVAVDSSRYAKPSSAIEQGLYRVAQEAVNNVVKHARAKSLRVALMVDGDAVHMRVADDGTGFDATRPAEAEAVPSGPAQGMGLSNMRERVGHMGGQIHIDSTAGVGTTIHVVVSRTTGEKN